MNFPDSYLTIGEPAYGEFKDKGSKFLAYVFAINSEEDAKAHLKKLRIEHHAAAHVCWAYCLGPEGIETKSSDDREPSGSAGKPILRTIKEKKLTNVLIGVVRYFGGKLLGVPGLIHAYGESAKIALDQTDIKEKKVFIRIFQPCTFELQHVVIRLLKQQQLKFYPSVNDSIPGIIFEIAPSAKTMVLDILLDQGFLEQIEKEIIYV